MISVVDSLDAGFNVVPVVSCSRSPDVVRFCDCCNGGCVFVVLFVLSADVLTALVCLNGGIVVVLSLPSSAIFIGCFEVGITLVSVGILGLLDKRCLLGCFDEVNVLIVSGSRSSGVVAFFDCCEGSELVFVVVCAVSAVVMNLVGCFDGEIAIVISPVLSPDVVSIVGCFD